MADEAVNEPVESTRYVKRTVTLQYVTPYNHDAPDDLVLNPSEDVVFMEMAMQQTLADVLGIELISFSSSNEELTDPQAVAEQEALWARLNDEASTLLESKKARSKAQAMSLGNGDFLSAAALGGLL